jgi:glycosyltransferase involved in cell wall biosynthesis/tetratricopeptide (TPR) repeat protein
LFGPVNKTFADQNLHGAVERGECVVFDEEGDFPIRWDDTWEAIAARFPAGWQPDFLALFLEYRVIPQAVWNAPIPIIGLAGDWNLLWHHYRHVLPRCDLVFTDRLGVETLAKAGVTHARSGCVYGSGRQFLEDHPEGEPRPIDVLFVGSFHAAIQSERLRWLARLAKLGDRWNVRIAAGVFGEDYRRLVRQSRIVFNRGIRRELNLRVGEAIGEGALLFQEADNLELPGLLADRKECVYYTDDNLEELLTHYLEHEEERKGIAKAARKRLPDLSFESRWAQMLEEIEAEAPNLRAKSCRRRNEQHPLTFHERAWQQISAYWGSDTTLASGLETDAQNSGWTAAAFNLQGIGWLLNEKGDVERAAQAFQDAWSRDPRHLMAGLNLAETLLLLGQKNHAGEQAYRTLALLNRFPRLSADVLIAPHAPPKYDLFRVQWERAAWANGGNPAAEAHDKSQLLRWRLHQLLADATGDLVHFFQAHEAKPDLVVSQRALGLALGRANRPAEALPYFRAAYKQNPFERDGAVAYSNCLLQLGLTADQQTLVQDRQNFAKAAPDLIPMEPWFARRPLPPVFGNDVQPLRVVWQGTQRAVHSFALINREICSRLIKRGHELSIMPATNSEPLEDTLSLPDDLKARMEKPLTGPADVHVSNQWPPDFQRPSQGRWVVMQPWEFGSMPRAWLPPLAHQVDEVWASSNFVRDCYIQGGVPACKVHVIPLGVAGIFFEKQPALPLKTKKAFRFLFVGGTIERKGIDLLLKTYHQVFSVQDDVCLVIKNICGNTFYHGQTAEGLIEQYQRRPHAPEVEYLNQELTAEQMAGLYSACHCLVHPYRGEGFGLPMAEAMASGLPAIVTGLGAALDFCREDHAYLIPARQARFKDKRVGDTETVDYPWWAEPDPDSLRLLLRHVAENYDEAKAKGARAREFIGGHFTWEHTAAAVEVRLQQLTSLAPRVTNEPVRPDVLAPLERMGISIRSDHATVSLTMIVKNEEHNLPACLDSVADLVDEVIVVDTGSTDATVDVAKRRGAKVFHFPWVDSFAAARNEALRHATGQWILWMDADDRLDQENRRKLQELLTDLPSEITGFVMKCLCVPDQNSATGTVVDHVRLFPNHQQLRWKYRIHEQILGAIRALRGNVRWSDVVIQHIGYQDPAVRKSKMHRDLRLLHLENQENPDDPFTLFNLGSSYLEQNRPAQAVEALERSLRRSDSSDSIVRKLYSLIAQSYRLLGDLDKALAACREGRQHYPKDPEILFQESINLQTKGDKHGAIDCLLQIVEEDDGTYFASVDTGLRGCKGHHNLAVLYLETDQAAQAEWHWRRSLEKEPSFLPALVGLCDFYLKRNRQEEFQEVSQMLEKHPQGQKDVALFNARRLLADKDFETARALVNEIIERHPDFLPARTILSHIFLQENRDWEGAERALRDILAHDPGNREARHNLDVLLKRTQSGCMAASD